MLSLVPLLKNNAFRLWKGKMYSRWEKFMQVLKLFYAIFTPKTQDWGILSIKSSKMAVSVSRAIFEEGAEEDIQICFF